MSSSPRDGTVKPQQSQRASGTPSGAPSSSETTTFDRFFPVSYKKQTYPLEQQFKQKQSEPLSAVEDRGAAREQEEETSITDDDITCITGSQGIPVRRTTAFDFPCQAASFLLSEDFMEQFVQRFIETASKLHQDLSPSLPRLLPPEKGNQTSLESFPSSYVLQLPGGFILSFHGAAQELRDAQESLVPVLHARGKETKQDVEKPQNQADPEKEEAASKLQTQQSTPVSKKTQISDAQVPSATDWIDIRKEVFKGENLKMIGSRSMAMPVTCDAQDEKPRWEPLDREAVKDLMKAIRDKGLGSSYFKQLLKGTFKIYDLTPFDLKCLASLILTDSQFIIWDAKWRRALDVLRNKYQGGPKAGFTVAQLAGDPPLDNPARQASLFPREVLIDIKDAARKAMVKIPLAGVSESSYIDIKQGPSESFTSFIDRLKQAMDRQVCDEWLKPHLLRCFAFMNTNTECKRIISALPGLPSMAEMIEACSRVGTPQHVTTIWGDQVERVIKAQYESTKEVFVTHQKNNSTMATTQCYRSTLLGKVLRIDVDGRSPGGKPFHICPDNPFVSDPKACLEDNEKTSKWEKQDICIGSTTACAFPGKISSYSKFIISFAEDRSSAYAPYGLLYKLIHAARVISLIQTRFEAIYYNSFTHHIQWHLAAMLHPVVEVTKPSIMGKRVWKV
ncbi:hypothetical protein DUI87_09870 [Hirundo rustica rustica]|uniref:Retroviral nucleocapsid Gag protein p24 C-terminal domain-containing protein n=1 Tax=Hirundo rustica rustica TaxID=333673 RepID=A0A3M0KH01_HIRRU|nr:hypothetical protein DUI87_09870 [Hirundo rustica rustica]